MVFDIEVGQNGNGGGGGGVSSPPSKSSSSKVGDKNSSSNYSLRSGDGSGSSNGDEGESFTSIEVDDSNISSSYNAFGTPAAGGGDKNGSSSGAGGFHLLHLGRCHKCLFAILIVVVGTVAASAFVSLGVTSFHKEQQLLFSTSATQFATSLEEAFNDYEIFGLWIHESCRASPYRTNGVLGTTVRPPTLPLPAAGDDAVSGTIATTAATSFNKNDTSTRRNSLGLCSRKEFRELYEYVQSVGLNFQSAQFMPNVTHAQRAVLEEEAAEYYEEHYPELDYRGITGLFPKPEGGGVNILPQVEQPFYFPVHYVEPVIGNEAAIELDLWSSQIQRKTIESAMGNWKPALTDRLRLVQETDSSQSVYSIILHHPGVPITTRPELERPEGSSLLVIRIPDLLERASKQQFSSSGRKVYLYDVTYVNAGTVQGNEDAADEQQEPVFLGAATLSVKDGKSEYIPLPEVDITTIHQGGAGMSTATSIQARSGHRSERRDMDIADRKWTVIVVSDDDSYRPNVFYVALGGSIIFMASVILAIWFMSHMYRSAKLNEVKSKAEAEKSAIIVETARRQALAERQLNEYIAHEVRNPLSSAIAALSFVSSATEEQEQQLVQQRQQPQQLPSKDDPQRSVKEDIAIIDSSLQFINELLRNMLDMNRAASKQMKIELSPTDILRDVLQPVAAILFLRGSKVKVLIDCPSNLVIQSDRLRLKQVILNLAINSSKFVEEGYIRLGARVVEEHDGDVSKGASNRQSVHVFVEDSGPGVPKEKRGRLFVKFQESLDMLSQGTGIGLCLCSHLAQLMDGTIFLDETFHSGVNDNPGTRFVVALNAIPLDPMVAEAKAEAEESESSLSHLHLEGGEVTLNNGQSVTDMSDIVRSQEMGSADDLPEGLSVLFCDDDRVLRKLFTRSLRRVAPTWKVQEAANGETALHLVESQEFDLIFLDQYMASINKQLLGSETARALRAKGVKSLICGLSANDVEHLFKDAGATAFMFKPFPCGVVPLRKELSRILYDEGSFDRPTATLPTCSFPESDQTKPSMAETSEASTSISTSSEVIVEA